MNPRLVAELELLRRQFGDVDFDEATGWFRIRDYAYPEPCQPPRGPIVFQISPAYPGAPPYGFAVPATARFKDQAFTGGSPPSPPPFDGPWVFLSWQPDEWQPAADLLSGSNLWGWARGFASRLKEGP